MSLDILVKQCILIPMDKDDVQEHVLCAANWYPDLVFPEAREDLDSIYWLPQNVSQGIVFSGRHHLQCMYQMIQTFGLRQCEVKECQGFLTSHNRWVTRQEAGEIAFAAGQTDRLLECLYSEHLYYPYPKTEKRELPENSIY